MVYLDAFLVMKPEQPQWTRHFRLVQNRFIAAGNVSTD